MVKSSLLLSRACSLLLLGTAQAFVARRPVVRSHVGLATDRLYYLTNKKVAGVPPMASTVRRGSSSSLARPSPRSALGASLAIPDPDPVLKYPAPPKKPFRFMPIKTVCRFLQVYVLGGLVLGGTFIMNSVASFLFIFLKFWWRKIELRRFGGFKTAYSMPPSVELQFDFGRMLSYVPYLIAAADNLFQLRWKMFSADELVGPTIVPTDGQFISQVLLRSPIAFYIRNTPNKLIANLTALNDIDNFADTYYDVTLIEVDKATAKITIHTKKDGAITQDKVDANEWDKAKVHAMACMSYYIPGIGHSWVHFNLMDNVAATAYNELDRKSILYSLLEPHTRYTNRINWEALGVKGSLVWGGNAVMRMGAEATSAVPRGWPIPFPLTLFEPFTPFAMAQQEFARNNAKRTTEYYFRSDEFACPPKWMDTAEADIPYIKALKRFYPVCREHVANVLKYEDPETITKFLEAVDRNSECDGYSLGLMRFDPIDAVASILFDCIFIHSTDHHFTFEIYGAARYGVGTIRHPFSRWWYPGMNVPSDMLDEEDRVRWDSCTKVFFRFNDSKLFPNTLKGLRYKFRRSRKELKESAKNFLKAIEDEQIAMKKDGDMYCPVEALSRSICW